MGGGAHAQSAADLAKLSLEDLVNLEVTSVSKRPEPLRMAPAAVFVIHPDEIARSGANSLPEVLRLAPNLHVAQAGASRYVVTARGLNGSSAAQSFSNKLLVMVDGRSVYSPLFSGVYWDMQAVMLEDVEQIEVVSGPGGTLWGANAFNGVINVNTRSSAMTQGTLVSGAAGTQERRLAIRHGGRLSDALTYRAYVRGLEGDSTDLAGGGSAQDPWERLQAGVRIDWALDAATELTIQGDVSEGRQRLAAGRKDEFRGRNAMVRWRRSGADGSQIRVQGFYDRVERTSNSTDGKFAVDMFDVEAQHAFQVGPHQIVWGGGLRASDYRIQGTPTFFFRPAARTLWLANAFIQDSIAVTSDLRLTLGLKIEDDPYVKATPLYNARLAWTPVSHATFWAAVSTAVRSPTPFDRDVVEVVGGQEFLIGNGDFRHEKLTAYEAGIRLQPTPASSLSVSAFYNDYRHLRNIEFTPTTLTPLFWGNGMEGHTRGVEAWGEWRPTPWWRLSAGYAYLDNHLDFAPGASPLLGIAQAGNDPSHRFSLSSGVSIGDRLTFDAHLRRQSRLPEPALAAFTELDLRLAWAVSEDIELSLVGRNLLHERHVEFPPENAIPRSAQVGLSWRF